MLSDEFKAAVHAAIAAVRTVPDDSIQYMLTGFGNPNEVVPIYVEAAIAPEQAAAGGCASCRYLGLWADRWNGYPPSPHGMIWLFEDGIRSMRSRLAEASTPLNYLGGFVENVRTAQGDLVANTTDVLVHELSHALQRDHVLDAMERARQQGIYAVAPAARAQQAGCNTCPGRSVR